MGLFDCLKGKPIDEYVAEAEDAGAIVLDVREPYEYKQGHVPGAVNIPLGQVDDAVNLIPDKDAILYVYCAAGVRSARACRRLTSLGYAKVTNIGGINSYRGPLES